MGQSSTFPLTTDCWTYAGVGLLLQLGTKSPQQARVCVQVTRPPRVKAERRHDRQLQLLLSERVERVPISLKAGAGDHVRHIHGPGTRNDRLHCLVMSWCAVLLGAEARVMEMAMRIDGRMSLSCWSGRDHARQNLPRNPHLRIKETDIMVVTCRRSLMWIDFCQALGG